MVYIKVDDTYADGDFNLLKDFLEMIDTKLSEISNRGRHYVIGDKGVLDTLEYYAGFGFIAIQCYFHSTYPQITARKGDALKVCPNGLMETLNAGANFAKHSEEWYRFEDGLPERQLKTLNTFVGDSDFSEFISAPCINKLYELTSGMAFSGLLPQIEEWRSALDRLTSIA